MIDLNERVESLFTHLMVSIKAGSKGLVRFKLASDLSAKMTRGLFAPIYSKITPEGLGEDYQELMVAYEYGTRLARLGGNISDAAVKRLVNEYPSHDFVIDSLEARSLFHKIGDPTSDMIKLALALQGLAFVPDAREVTVEALSKADETKADEFSKKGSSNEEPKRSEGNPSGNPGSSAA